ncbi:hypothetical protein FEM33_15255 [Dyadobacter flavalbus]|uniref:Uncharacterized protein n=1 Tax=Dyadobacter flavalbus TaxID=2579942 RepID=A0A5M8QUY5_9BACT|nr:hypothetical protein [Dyadobacter flavalbus]KAA6438870.1 hypothetical protein FEM33_15255 [Dyadobacter flavalbus]
MDIDSTYSNSVGRSFFEEHWSRHARLFGKEVLVVSKAYEDAAVRASDKLYNLVESIREKKEFNLSIQGSYIVKSVMFMCDLRFDNTDGFEGVLYIFLPNGIPYGYISLPEGRIWVSKDSDVNIQDTTDLLGYFCSLVDMIFVIKLFQLYADSELKVVKPNQTLKKLDLGYIKNESPFEITYLNSNWFTTLVRSEGFEVRGHFRLQPKKVDGEWTKELIWISDFVKSGYTSKSKI